MSGDCAGSSRDDGGGSGGEAGYFALSPREEVLPAASQGLLAKERVALRRDNSWRTVRQEIALARRVMTDEVLEVKLVAEAAQRVPRNSDLSSRRVYECQPWPIHRRERQ